MNKGIESLFKEAVKEWLDADVYFGSRSMSSGACIQMPVLDSIWKINPVDRNSLGVKKKRGKKDGLRAKRIRTRR